MIGVDGVGVYVWRGFGFVEVAELGCWSIDVNMMIAS